MSALVKAIGHGLPLTELMFLRSLIALPFLLGVVVRGGHPLVVRDWKTLLLRTLFGTSAMFCFYYALTNMPLADCVFIGRIQPILLALLAPFLIDESAGKNVWIAIVVGLFGAGLIIKPQLSWTTASWVALAASFLSALAHLMIRRLCRSDPSPVIVLNFTTLLCVISGFISFPSLIVPSPHQWLLLLGISVFASLGQFLLTRAYSLDRAPTVAAASYASVVLSIIYGYLFWNEIPLLSSLAGALVIVSTGMYLMITSMRAK